MMRTSDLGHRGCLPEVSAPHAANSGHRLQLEKTCWNRKIASILYFPKVARELAAMLDELRKRAHWQAQLRMNEMDRG